MARVGDHFYQPNSYDPFDSVRSNENWNIVKAEIDDKNQRIEALEDKVSALQEAKDQMEENVAGALEMVQRLMDEVELLQAEVRRYKTDEETVKRQARAKEEALLKAEAMRLKQEKDWIDQLAQLQHTTMPNPTSSSYKVKYEDYYDMKDRLLREERDEYYNRTKKQRNEWP